MIWKKLAGLLAITVLSVLVELVYLYLARTGESPSFRIHFKPNLDLF